VLSRGNPQRTKKAQPHYTVPWEKWDHWTDKPSNHPTHDYTELSLVPRLARAGIMARARGSADGTHMPENNDDRN